MNFKTLLFIGSLFALSCQPSENKKETAAVDIGSVPLIPKPVSVTPAQGQFALNEKTAIYVDTSASGLETVTGYLAQKLFPATGIKLSIASEKGDNQIALVLAGNDADLKEFAEKSAKVVEEHLKMAKETQGKLK